MLTVGLDQVEWLYLLCLSLLLFHHLSVLLEGGVLFIGTTFFYVTVLNWTRVALIFEAFEADVALKAVILSTRKDLVHIVNLYFVFLLLLLNLVNYSI